MRKIWRLCGLIGLFGLSGAAVAGQSAGLVCVQVSPDGGCDVYELRVLITSDGDVGRPGAFGIGAQLAGGGMVYWTMVGGWAEYRSGFVPPVDGYHAGLPSRSEYVIYRGPFAGVCALSGGSNFSLYAAHGALTPEKEIEVNAFAARLDRLPADYIQRVGAKAGGTKEGMVDHMRHTFIQTDVTRDIAKGGSAKGGKVYSQDC